MPIFGRFTAQVDWVGLMVGGHRRSVCIHQMNRVNSLYGFGYDDSTMNIVVIIIIIILPTSTKPQAGKLG